MKTLGDRHLCIHGDSAAPLYRQMSPETAMVGKVGSFRQNRCFRLTDSRPERVKEAPGILVPATLRKLRNTDNYHNLSHSSIKISCDNLDTCK